MAAGIQVAKICDKMLLQDFLKAFCCLDYKKGWGRGAIDRAEKETHKNVPMIIMTSAGNVSKQ